MDFSSFLSKKEAKSFNEYFWALIIEPSWVQAGIWRVDENQATVVFSGIPAAWSNDSDLVTSTDAVLSAAVQSLSDENAEPTKTVFAVVSSWVEGGQIKPEYLEKIKNLCSELSLKPVGFVVISEAISYFLKSEEGSPLSAIVVGVYKEGLEISVFQLGSLLGVTNVSRSVSIVDDIAEGLSRFLGVQGLPSRFIIYDGRESETEEARQAIIQADWKIYEKVRFLHTPKVEIIDAGGKLKAVCLAGASEMAQVEKISVLTGEEKEDKKEDQLTPESVGFRVGGDFEIDKPQEAQSDVVSEEDLSPHQNIEPVGEFPSVNQEKPASPVGDTKKRFSLAGILPKFSSLTNRVRNVSIGKMPIVVGLACLVAFLLAGILGWWFLPRATVTVYISPKTLNENYELTIGEGQFSEGKLQARTESVEVDGDLTIGTTGTKTTGEKAKGEVTIYRVGSAMTLPASTLIKGPNNLSFTLDEAVNVASGSASSPSATKANVTAVDIGASYNLSSGTSFVVGNYSSSDLEAKNERSFSGGSSREVSVISEQDMVSAEKELTNKLLEEAVEKLKSKAPEGEELIEDSIVSEPSLKKFSGKVGDEASELKLNLKLSVKGYLVSRSQMVKGAEEFLKGKLPSGYILKEENITTKLELVDRDEQKYRISITANLLPDIDVNALAEKILGRYPEVARQYMSKEVPGFASVEFEQNPPLPGRLGTLPHVLKNLEIELAVEK